MSGQASWSRRCFLSARGIGASAGGALAALLPDDPPALHGLATEGGYWRVTRRAMGCDFTVLLPPIVEDALAVGRVALDEIDELESLLSVYRADSALAYVNQYAADRPMRVDARLFELLERSRQLTQQTDGAFDVSAGALIEAWGYVIGPRRLPSEAELQTALTRTGMHHVSLDPAELTVGYAVEGLKINLGAIGKGYAVDWAVRRMREQRGIGCALVLGGASSLYGLGSFPAGGLGWTVGIETPFAPQRRIATVRLRNRALGTAGVAHQYLEVQGRRYGHILDPRSGWPADGLGSASVLADDCATADALSTALFVMGLDRAAEFCHNHPEIAALLVLKAEPLGAAGRPRVATFNLPPEDVTLWPGDDPPDG